jgi:hypothetical protein
MACSSKPNKLWSSMSAILCRGLICCFDNMVPKWHYLWLDDIFCFGFLYQIHSPAKFATEILCPVCFMLADLLLDYHCVEFALHNRSCYHQCVFKRNKKLNKNSGPNLIVEFSVGTWQHIHWIILLWCLVVEMKTIV